ncbi:hypothetical protein BLOT_015712 [Blomia tropicalis]|nr:hypothetical protein BLOT_015712 [Blomia tropicalis]
MQFNSIDYHKLINTKNYACTFNNDKLLTFELLFLFNLPIVSNSYSHLYNIDRHLMFYPLNVHDGGGSALHHHYHFPLNGYLLAAIDQQVAVRSNGKDKFFRSLMLLLLENYYGRIEKKSIAHQFAMNRLGRRKTLKHIHHNSIVISSSSMTTITDNGKYVTNNLTKLLT